MWNNSNSLLGSIFFPKNLAFAMWKKITLELLHYAIQLDGIIIIYHSTVFGYTKFSYESLNCDLLNENQLYLKKNSILQ